MLSTTNMQRNQDSFNYFPKDESIKPALCTDLMSWNVSVRPLVQREPEGKDNFKSSSNYDLVGPENHPIRLIGRIKISLDEEDRLEAMSWTKTSENSLHGGYYLNCLHSSPYKKLFSPPKVKPSFKKLLPLKSIKISVGTQHTSYVSLLIIVQAF